jgi:hypothetical protein
MTRSLPQAVCDGIAALARMQAGDGSFSLFTRTTLTSWRPCGPLFSTSYIMLGAGSLLPVENIARALDYIRRQRRVDGLWEYDPQLGIPPDSDSTACSLAALALHGERSAIANGADLLRSFWRAGAGPFRTWRAQGMWSLPDRDDPVVNCNVVFALRLLGSLVTAAELGSVSRLLERSETGSRYYCAPSTIAHAARRAGISRSALPHVATARPALEDHLSCVQWMCGIQQRDEEITVAVLTAQAPDGGWPIGPWVTGVGKPTPYWGSPAVSTALAIEALRAQSR